MKGRKKKKKKKKKKNQTVQHSVRFKRRWDDKHPSNHQSHNHTHHTLHTTLHTVNTSSNFQPNPITLPLNSNASNYRFHDSTINSKILFRELTNTPYSSLPMQSSLQITVRNEISSPKGQKQHSYILHISTRSIVCMKERMLPLTTIHPSKHPHLHALLTYIHTYSV